MCVHVCACAEGRCRTTARTNELPKRNHIPPLVKKWKCEQGKSLWSARNSETPYAWEERGRGKGRVGVERRREGQRKEGREGEGRGGEGRGGKVDGGEGRGGEGRGGEGK